MQRSYYLLAFQIVHIRRKKRKEYIESTVTERMSEIHEIIESNEDVGIMMSDKVGERSNDDADGNGTCNDSNHFFDTQRASSNTSNSLFVDKNHAYRRLQKSVPARWNSTYVMMSSILDFYDPANKVLKKLSHYKMCFDQDEKELLSDFLKPFFKVYTVIQTELFNNVTKAFIYKSD